LDDKNPAAGSPKKITVDRRSGPIPGQRLGHVLGQGDGALARIPGRLVVLDRDLKAIPPEQIRGVKVVATVVGGGSCFQITAI
jgi:hypothetical protein